MNKYALGVAIVALGAVTQAVPAYADKLDDVLARLEAIEKNNAKLANENATLKARLNKVETTKNSAPGRRTGQRSCGPHGQRACDGYPDSADVTGNAGNRREGARIF